MKDIAPPHPTVAQLTAFDTGQLPASERETVEQHVNECPDCCRMLDTLPEDPLAALVRAFADGNLPIPAALVGHPRYRILEVLGKGGMGVVYKAVHRLMDRVVALKIIDQRLTDQPAFVERFRREVKAAARLSHPHIVTAYDSEQADDTHFLVMEYVPGTSLDKELARRGSLPVTEACEIVRQAALGLQHAHERGMVHRDVKPANLLLAPGGQVKIMDFGLARLADDETVAGTSALSATVLGTPDYLAPEQARDAHHADIRADIYSLGCTLYHLLVGQPPFPGGSPLQKLLAHQERMPRPVSELRSDVPETLDAILQRMLAKDPAQRYATPADVVRDLAPLAGHASPTPVSAVSSQPRRKPWKRWVAISTAAVVLAAVAVGVFLAWPETPDETPPAEKPKPRVEPIKVRQPGPLAEVVTLRQGPLSKQEMRQQALAWIKANNHWGPNDRFVGYNEKYLDAKLDLGDGVEIGFGPKLLKSQKATLLTAHPGGLFVTELPGDLVHEVKLQDRHQYFQMLQKVQGTKEVRLEKPHVLLSALILDDAGHLDRTRRVTGSVAYRIMDRSPGRLTLRLSFFYAQYRRLVTIQPKQLQSTDQGVLAFSLPALGNERVRPQGPLMVFVELSVEQADRIVIESNTVPALVNVTAGE